MSKLWLDDIRLPPEGWVWAKTAEVAYGILVSGGVTHASLDHDLGLKNVDAWQEAKDSGLLVCDEDSLDYDPLASDGYDLTKWMAENDVWPSVEIVIHSANPIGAKNMKATIDRYGPYDKPVKWIPYDLGNNEIDLTWALLD